MELRLGRGMIHVKTLADTTLMLEVELSDTVTAFGRLELEWCERKILLG